VRGGRKKTGKSTFSSTSVSSTFSKYFPTRSPVSSADIDGCRVGELMTTLFMGDDDELFQALIRDHMILTCLLEIFTPPTYKNTQAAFYSRSRNRPRTVRVSAPSSAAKADVDASPASPPTLSGVLFLVFLHLHTKSFCRLQVSRMALPLCQDSFCHVCLT